MRAEADAGVSDLAAGGTANLDTPQYIPLAILHIEYTEARLDGSSDHSWPTPWKAKAQVPVSVGSVCQCAKFVPCASGKTSQVGA